MWLADSVRELRFDERPSLREALLARHGLVELHRHGERWPIDALPALVCERGGERVGTLSFCPRPARQAVVFALDAFDDNIEAGFGRHSPNSATTMAGTESLRRTGRSNP